MYAFMDIQKKNWAGIKRRENLKTQTSHATEPLTERTDAVLSDMLPLLQKRFCIYHRSFVLFRSQDLTYNIREI